MPEVSDTLLTILKVDAADFERGFSRASGVLSAFGQRTAAAGAVLDSLRAGSSAFQALGRAAVAAGEEQAVYNRAAGNLKGSIPANEVAAFSGQMQALTGVADDQVGSLLGVLGTYQALGRRAEDLALPILNAAEANKALGFSADSVASQVGKALETGKFEGLRRVGVIVDETKAKTDAYGAVLEALQAQGGDAAITFRDTLPGSLQALHNAIGDDVEAFGQGLIPLLKAGANFGTSAAQAIAGLPGPVRTTAAVIGGTLVAGVGLAQVGFRLLEADNARLINSLLRGAGAADQQAGALTRLGLAGAAARVGTGGGGGGVVGQAFRAGGFGPGLGGAAIFTEAELAALAGKAPGPGFLARGGGLGLAGVLLATAGGLALGTIPDQRGPLGALKAFGSGALEGGGIGASVGSFFGPAGTAIGAGGGALVGGIASLIGEQQAEGARNAPKVPEKPVDPNTKHLQELVEKQDRIIRELQGIRDKGALAATDVPIGLQIQALADSL